MSEELFTPPLTQEEQKAVNQIIARKNRTDDSVSDGEKTFDPSKTLTVEQQLNLQPLADSLGR